MIRPATLHDLPEILEIYAPYVENTTYSFEYTVPSLEAFAQRFQTVTAQFPWLVYEEEGAIVGYAYASAPYERAAYRWCAEPSVYLREQARGQGIAAGLYAVLEEILQEQGYVVLYALITAENHASVRFHEKMGYHLQAEFPDCGFKQGRWCGLFWMEKRLKIVESPSCFPKPFFSIVQNAERFSKFFR